MPAFTLVELIVVIAIIGLLLGLVVPGASSLWAQRNEAATANMIRGLLASARSQAIRQGERGLFFYADDEGHQHVVFIEAEPPNPVPGSPDCVDCELANDCTAQRLRDACGLDDPSTLNRFRVTGGKVYAIPPPYRVAPHRVMLPYDANDPLSWQDIELANQRFTVGGIVGGTVEAPKYHINYFAIIFNSRGELVPGREVLIHDVFDHANPRQPGPGTATKLLVAPVTDAWTVGNVQTNIGSTGAELFDIVVLAVDGRGATFASVEGVVVYDHSAIDGLSDGVAIRDILAREGRPFYITRYTGDVVLGPRGEQ